MKTLEEFIETMIKIEFIEQSDCFGHYPFQLFVETIDGSFEINSLALGGDVERCYKTFAKYKKNLAKRIYLSLDFPKGLDMENDFVAIFSFENNEINLQLIPYLEDGTILDIIKESDLLNKIKSQFENFLK